MNVPRWIVAHLRGLWRRDGVAAEIDEELRFHVTARTEQYEREGLSQIDARRKAQARVGNVAIHLDRGYDIRGGSVMNTVLQDIRQSLRLLRHQPAFAAMAIGTLALGIGASTAVFSLIDAAMLRPLPYPQPEQIVGIDVEESPQGRAVSAFSPSLLDVEAWRRSTPVFSQLAINRSISPERILDGSEPLRLRGESISSEYLAIYGVVPAVGRGFTVTDEQPGSPAVVMLGYSLWQTRFGGQASVVGTTISYDGEPLTVIGVLPASFQRTTPIWRPLLIANESTFAVRRGTGIGIVGRLRPGVSLEDAQKVLTASLPATPLLSGATGTTQVRLTRELDSTIKGYRTTVVTLASAVGLILLIACVNVAGLLLARGATRQAEVAVRASLGATRGRLIRQFLSESVVLSVIGGVLGIALAWFTLQSLLTVLPLSLSVDAPARINGTVLIASVVLSILTGTLFGLIPALRLSSRTFAMGLARGGRQHSAALTRKGGQSLIAIEVALAVVMLAGAGLMLRSFGRLIAVDVGFDPDRYMTMEVRPVDTTPQAHAEYYPALVKMLRTMPSVAAAGAIDFPPLEGSSRSTNATAGDKRSSIAIRSVLPGYFEAISIHPIAGRLVEDRDVTSAEKIIVLSAGAARALFGDAPAVGQLVVYSEVSRAVIGVVPDVRHGAPGQAPRRPDIYVPFEATAERGTIARALTVLVAPKGDVPGLAGDLRRAAASIGPRVIVERIRSGGDWLSEGVTSPRRRTVLFSILGGFGLLLSIVGVVGMTSYAVARRTREIGVRMAFGARADQVVRAMLLDSVWPIAIGVGIGIGGAWLSTGVIKSFLYETTPTDPATLAAVAVTLAAAASVAAWLPARRAARVDPVTALRAE